MRLRHRLASLLLLVPLAPAAFAAAEPPAAPAIRTIGFLAVDGVYNSELMAPYDVLHHLRFHVEQAPEVFVVAPRRGPVLTFEGLTLEAHHGFDDAPPIDVLVVPSAEHSMDRDLDNAALIEFVRKSGARAQALLSLCDGAFVLAKAGLLDGLEATTFPADQDRFEKAFPKLRVRRGPLFVHDGKAVTGVGGAKSYEPALYLVEKLYGAEVARRIARGLVIDWALDAVPHHAAPGARLPERRR